MAGSVTTRSVRIPAEIDAKVVEIAEAEHIPINAAVVQALEQWVRGHEHRMEARATTAQVISEDEDLLRRLADS